MADWFRNDRWDDEIADAFEAKLARARDKAQYLTIQGFTLLSAQPDVAAKLLRRAVDVNDPVQTARAGLYLGTALAIGGDLDGAIAALQGAIDAEKRFPMHRTGAGVDQALLIAIVGRTDLYHVALERLGDERVLPFETQRLSALIAQTLILGERGEHVEAMAVAAVNRLRDAEGGGDLPAYLSIDALRLRLGALAA